MLFDSLFTYSSGEMLMMLVPDLAGIHVPMNVASGYRQWSSENGASLLFFIGTTSTVKNLSIFRFCQNQTVVALNINSEKFMLFNQV
jgi:hypothetical protein